MSKKLHAVIEAFPKYEELSGSNPEFETLCHRFSEVTEELHKLEQGPESESESKSSELKHRRNALSEQLHALMSASMRV
jgi:uncharacterized protein YdcH (DUF465 family)